MGLIFILIFLSFSSATSSNNAVTLTSPNLSNANKLDRKLLRDSTTIPKTTPSQTLSKKDYIAGLFSCRRCKVYMRDDVAYSGGFAPPSQNRSSSNKKTKVGVIVGLSFLLLFIILAVCGYLCRNDKSSSSSSGGSTHRQPEVGVNNNRHQKIDGVNDGDEKKKKKKDGKKEDEVKKKNKDSKKEEEDEKKKKKKDSKKEDEVKKKNKDGKKDEDEKKKKEDEVKTKNKDSKKEEEDEKKKTTKDGIKEDGDKGKEGNNGDGKKPQTTAGNTHKSQPQQEVGTQNNKGRDGKRTTEVGEKEGDNNTLGLPKKFTYKYLKKLTGTFADKNEIGKGSNVYKGIDGTTEVVVKRLTHVRKMDDFEEVVASIYLARHGNNLVTLEGYCDTGTSKYLVYKYISEGSLEKWIFIPEGSSSSSLTWPEKKKIIQGTANGLVHLHNNCGKVILHRDLSPANVLLDENKDAKLCDYGMTKLSKKGQTSSTSKGPKDWHIAPEVFGRKDNVWEENRITDRVDVYSFGIIVLEILFGKQYFNLANPDCQDRVEANHLPDLIKMLLPSKGEDEAKEIERIGRLAVLCTENEPKKRPTMSEVLGKLNV